jgi:hypothetical protein
MKELIKRADGSYSQRGLWDNIRAKAKKNKRTGETPEEPTTKIKEQGEKIIANSKMMGGIMSPLQVPRQRISNKGAGLGTAIAAGGLALAASKLFGGKGDVMPDVGKMKYGGKMKNC